jgi:hypothetical protein
VKSLFQCPDFPELPAQAIAACPDILRGTGAQPFPSKVWLISQDSMVNSEGHQKRVDFRANKYLIEFAVKIRAKKAYPAGTYYSALEK